MALSRDKSAASPNAKWLTIVGIGEDGVAGLGEAARRAIVDAAHVFGGERHLTLARELISGRSHQWPQPFDPTMAAVTALRHDNVCVLASGDPFLWGVGATLSRAVEPQEMRVLPAPSAFSLAAGRLGWPLHGLETLSLHGLPLSGLRRHLQPGRRLLALTSGADAPGDIAAYISALGFGPSTLTVLEALGGADERITAHVASSFASSFATGDINPLNLVAIDAAAGPQARAIARSPGRPDDWFLHDGQITKREVRALSLSALAPLDGQRLWDIGAGAGSVAIEWLLSGAAMAATAIERDTARAARIRDNAEAFGVAMLDIVTGQAPDALAGLEPPDAVFIGGGGSDPGVIDAAMAALRPGGRLVANAVTLEMEAVVGRMHATQGGTLARLAIARAEPLGAMTGWRPALPVTQWAWMKPRTTP